MKSNDNSKRDIGYERHINRQHKNKKRREEQLPNVIRINGSGKEYKVIARLGDGSVMVRIGLAAACQFSPDEFTVVEWVRRDQL